MDSITPSDNQYIISDAMETQEHLEHIIPLLLLSLSAALLFSFTYVNNLLFHFIDFNLAFWGMMSIVTLFVNGFAVMNFRIAKFAYTNYQNWRQLWCDFWDLLKLLSLSRESAGLEFGFRVIDEYLHSIEFDLDNTDQLIEEIVEKYSLSIAIPADSERKNRVMLNLVLYHLCNTALNETNTRLVELEQILHFQERARIIINAIQDLTLANVHTDLAIAVLFATYYDEGPH